MLANCQLTGTVPSADRYAEARESARKSIARGSASGGMTLFNAFQLDPRFSYTGADGRVDARKYDALAATPIDARTEQAAAWSGLSLALERHDALGALLAGAALVDTSAPGNQERLLAIAERSPAVARQFAAQVGIARLFKKFGGTHASVKAAVDAHRGAMAAAMLGSEMLGTEKCIKLELARTEPGSAPAEAQYLPVASGPLVNAYLIRGQWQEAWTYHGCGREYAVQVSFTADGWGGVRFQTLYKRS